MNAKRYVGSVVVVLVFLTLSGWLIHGVLLEDLYMAHQQFWRPIDVMKRLMPFIHLSNFIFALLFCFIYTKGLEGKSPVGEGLRYGLLIGLLIHLPMTITEATYVPYPMKLYVAWLIGGVIETTLAGGLLGLTYRKA